MTIAQIRMLNSLWMLDDGNVNDQGCNSTSPLWHQATWGLLERVLTEIQMPQMLYFPKLARIEWYSAWIALA